MSSRTDRSATNQHQYREDERRTIGEVIAIYELEPNLHDVYVEGRTDAAVVRWLLSKLNLGGVVVYEIDSIEVPTSDVLNYGFSDGNRGRVLTLGFELCRSLPTPVLQATCVADSDFDHILRQEHVCEAILLTDYTCLEMYLFDEEVLQKFLDVVLHGFSERAETILTTLSDALEKLFLIRLAADVLKLNIEWMECKNCCSIIGSQLHFDADEFLTRYLNKGNQHSQRENVEKLINQYKQHLALDRRHQIHGHDFVYLLAWYLLKLRAMKDFCRVEVLGPTLFGCLEVDQLSNIPLFQSLIQRVTGT